MEVDGSQLEWRISFQNRLEQAHEDGKSEKWRKVTIYRAPDEYREVNNGCLDPKRFSLGPYHSSNSKLSKENPVKLRVLYDMLKRNDQKIDLYIDAMLELEQEARSCYEGDILLNENEFVEMMVVDGCFIIEFLHCMISNKEELGYQASHPFYDGKVPSHEIISDMLLLENQIPISVLKKLAQQQQNPAIGDGFIPNRAIWMFNNFTSPNKRELYDKEKDKIDSIKGEHILDIVRGNLLTGTHSKEEKDEFNLNFPCASKLKETRVKFKVLEGHQFCKVDFTDQTLQLTQLYLETRSKTLFCNLVAYEQRHPHADKVITSYLTFMNQLIDSTEDVKHLIESKIIRNMLGSHKEVVDLFGNTTTKDMFSLRRSYPQTIVKSINKHVNNTWNRWRATLIEKYFKTPWSTISIVAAFTLILLTFIQTFYTVYDFYHPQKP